jgi:hypothetical protein
MIAQGGMGRTHCMSCQNVVLWYPLLTMPIDKAAKRGVIKDNAAARTKSRLTKFVAKSGEKK